MTREEFEKSLGLIVEKDGRMILAVNAREFVLFVYLGKKGCSHEELEYFYGRVLIYDELLLGSLARVTQSLKHEWDKTVDDMYMLAQEKFGEDLEGIVVSCENVEATDFESVLSCVVKEREHLKGERDARETNL